MTKCDQTCHWDLYESKDHTVDVDMECILEAGHPLWHTNGEFYWDKYGDNRTADMEEVEKLIDQRIQEQLVKLSRKGLI